MIRIPEKTTNALFELIRPQYWLVSKALTLSILASLLEGTCTAIVVPLLQVLGNTTGGTEQTIRLFQFLTNFYTVFPSRWQLLAVAISFVVLTALKNLSRYLSNISVNELQLRTGMQLRYDCIKRFLSLELPFHNHSKTGELLSYANEHAQRSESLISYILEIVNASITILVLFILLIYLSPTLTLVAIISISIGMFFLQKVVQAVQIYGRKAANLIENFSSLVTEIVIGIRVVKSFNSEFRELERSKYLLEERYKAEMGAYKYTSAVAPLTETVGIVILLTLLAVGSSLASINQNIALPILLTYVLGLLRILPRVSHLNSMRSQISLLSGSVEVIQNFLVSTENLSLEDGLEPYKDFQSTITFKDVVFSFDSGSEPTLKGINFQLKKGTTNAIVGPSGSGKSTLVDLIMRFHDPDLGSIQVDGIDLRQFQRSSWRQSIAMVSQDTFLFNASVRENIAYGFPEATDRQIVESTKQAYAYDFIQDLPQKFDTVLGNRGVKLSGGQRQRIAIARAILRSPSILILDEATSALDSASERIVQKAIEEVSRERTVIVIAHRLSTIENADNIIVLRAGQVVEQGTHKELLVRQKEYWSLHKSHLFSDEQFPQSIH